MRERIKAIFQDIAALQARTLADNQGFIVQAAEAIIHSLRAGGKIIIFGNGGSAADSQHMAAELVGRFQKERRPFPAIALSVNASSLTALANDYSFDIVFARQLDALGSPGDIAFAISTSGNSKNVIEAVKIAKQKGLKTISLTGNGGGALAPLTDINLNVPSSVTARVQELHVCLIHCICEMVEEDLS